MSLVIAAAFVLSMGAGPESATAGYSLRGTVLDTARAAIAAARVEAVPDRGGAGASTRTDRQGDFALALRPGGYTIRVVARGFLEASQRVTAGAAGGESREFVLKVAGFQETVTVNAPMGTRWPPSAAPPGRSPRFGTSRSPSPSPRAS